MFYTAGFIISLMYVTYCSAEGCKDESALCNITIIDVCSQNETRKYCPKTCGFCDPDVNNSTAAPTEECSDQWTNCTKLEADICQSDSDVARIYCFKTCNNCTATMSTTIRPNVATHSDPWLTIIYCVLLLTTVKLMV